MNNNSILVEKWNFLRVKHNNNNNSGKLMCLKEIVEANDMTMKPEGTRNEAKLINFVFCYTTKIKFTIHSKEQQQKFCFRG